MHTYETSFMNRSAEYSQALFVNGQLLLTFLTNKVTTQTIAAMKTTDAAAMVIRVR